MAQGHSFDLSEDVRGKGYQLSVIIFDRHMMSVTKCYITDCTKKKKRISHLKKNQI